MIKLDSYKEVGTVENGRILISKKYHPPKKFLWFKIKDGFYVLKWEGIEGETIFAYEEKEVGKMIKQAIKKINLWWFRWQLSRLAKKSILDTAESRRRAYPNTRIGLRAFKGDLYN